MKAKRFSVIWGTLPAIVVGAALNVLVSWILAWFLSGRNLSADLNVQAVTVHQINQRSLHAAGLHLTRQERIGIRIDDFVYRRVALMGGPSLENARATVAHTDASNMPEVDELAEWWLEIPSPQPEFEQGVMGKDEYVVVATGWPWPSMSYTIARHGVNTSSTEIAGGVELNLNQNRHDYQPALPLRPRWVPFMMNTALFGVMIVGAVVLFRSARRLVRGRRRRCLVCGYDLRGADHTRCPECGTQCARLTQ